jgi:hypothetical protein
MEKFRKTHSTALPMKTLTSIQRLNTGIPAHKLRFYGGLQGSAGKRLDYTLSVSNTIIGDMPLFVNDTLPLQPFSPSSTMILILFTGTCQQLFTFRKRSELQQGFDISTTLPIAKKRHGINLHSKHFWKAGITTQKTGF